MGFHLFALQINTFVDCSGLCMSVSLRNFDSGSFVMPDLRGQVVMDAFSCRVALKDVALLARFF